LNSFAKNVTTKKMRVISALFKGFQNLLCSVGYAKGKTIQQCAIEAVLYDPITMPLRTAKRYRGAKILIPYKNG